MAVYIHRAYDPDSDQFVYWQAEELDLDGEFYIGPPDFSILENPVVLRRYLIPSGANYDVAEVVPQTLVTLEEVP